MIPLHLVPVQLQLPTLTAKIYVSAAIFHIFGAKAKDNAKNVIVILILIHQVWHA
jgi:hypothetical protein